MISSYLQTAVSFGLCPSRFGQYSTWSGALGVCATTGQPRAVGLQKLGWRLLPLLLLCCVLSPALSQAAERMKDLGLVRVWVADSSEAQREAVLGQALSEVVVRMTGDRQSLKTQAVKTLEKEASQYLVSFSYVRPTAAQLAQRGALDLSTQGLWLELRFEQTSLIDQLRQRGVAVWGELRPRLLLWWASESGGQQSVLAREPDSPLQVTIGQTAARRGIPLTLPNMDAEDARQVSAESIIGFRASDIRKASTRYGSDAIVVVSARRYGPNFWEADWQLSINENTYWFEGQTQSSEELAVLVVEEVADRLSSLYARTGQPDSTGQVHLHVIDVADFKMYQQIEQHLGQLSVVKQRHLAMAQAHQLDYLLLLDGSVQAFENALALGGRLKPTGRAVRANSGTDTQQTAAPEVDSLEYYWVGP